MYQPGLIGNTNGLFDAGERQFATVPIGFIGPDTLTWSNVVLTGATGTTGTYSRLRISTANLSSAGGTVADGEVEDYYVPFVAVLPVSDIFILCYQKQFTTPIRAVAHIAKPRLFCSAAVTQLDVPV